MKVENQQWPSSFPFAPWYLDAVARGWQYTESLSSEGHLLGVLPYVVKKKMGLSILTPPPLSPRLGPFVFYPKGQNLREKQAFEWKVLTQLEQVLPKVHYAKINWPYELTNGLVWQQLGWQQKVRYSYVLDLSQQEEEIWKGFKPNLRNKIRKAEKLLSISSSEDFRIPYDLTQKIFEHRKTAKQLSFSMIERLDKVANKQDARKIFIAKDSSGIIHGAIWLLKDQSSAFNLLLGSDPNLRSSGAAPLLLWHAIQWAKDDGLMEFDFEGSHIKGVESFFRSFGGLARPYFQFTKGVKWLKMAKMLVKP